MGPFQVIETVGQQAYRLSLLTDWKVHFVFHVSLLKNWRIANLQEDLPVTPSDGHEIEERYYEIDRILRWRKVNRNKKVLK